MVLKLDIKRKFSQRSDRVKGVDLHPTEPWMLANLYNGHVCIWNHVEGTLVKSFEAADLPARCSKFVARKQWVITGSDDMFIRVYNYNTMDKVKTFEAHTDYIRSIAVHPSLPYLLSASDDQLIKLWDWDKNWQCTQVFEGHSHYVMQVVFNPKDTNTFASASLDRTVKVWSVGQPTPNFTLEGHEKGVNCVDYFTGGDRPYLISGADDKLCKVWDYQTKACVQTLEGHSHNVSAVCFHPELPIIVTGSEDGTIKIWHNTTYRMENTLSYGMERVWALGYVRGSNNIAVGFDEGSVIIKMGSEEPVASMDASGKIIYARHNEIQTASIKALVGVEMADGERLPLAVKDLGSSELYPSALKHNSNGRFVVVCGDGEYIVYTALAWRNRSFGSAAEFVWSAESNDFAVRETSPNAIKIHKNFKEAATIPLASVPEGIHGGAMLGVRASDHISFYDWNSCQLIRRIDVVVQDVVWNATGDMLALTTATGVYILKYDKDVVEAVVASGAGIDEDGIEDAFEVVAEVEERVRTGLWVGDCFIYNNSSWRLNYCVGGEVTTMYHLDRPMYLLGYMASQQRVYLIDKEYAVVSFTLLLSLVQFKTLVMRDELDEAYELLETIPKDQHNGVAKFLEARGLTQKALQVAVDPEYRFELAVQLNDFPVAIQIAEELQSESRWKQLGEMALADGKLQLAEQCLQKSGDVSGMLLMYSATGNSKGMQELCELAKSAGKINVAFLANFLLQNVDACIDILISSNRLPEAGFFARTYKPSRASEMVKLWQDDLKKVNPKAAEALADPAEYPNLFPDLELALQAEEAVSRGHQAPAHLYPQHEGMLSRDLIREQRLQFAAFQLEDRDSAGGTQTTPGEAPTALTGAAEEVGDSEVQAEEEVEVEVEEEVEVEVEEEEEVDDNEFELDDNGEDEGDELDAADDADDLDEGWAEGDDTKLPQ